MRGKWDQYPAAPFCRPWALANHPQPRRSLLLLLFFQRPPLLHEISIETRLLSLLLLQVDACDEAAPQQLHLVPLLVPEVEAEGEKQKR